MNSPGGKFIFWLVYLLVASCISPFEPVIVKDNPKLTVDGLITDQPGPYRITLRYSAPYVNDETVFSRYEANASVSIFDDLGNSETLSYKEYGVYETLPDFIGKVGRSYSLNIKVPNGKTYQSQPEQLRQTAAIDSVYTTYEELHGVYLRGLFSLYLDFSDPIESKDFYQWDWVHYKFEPYCLISYKYNRAVNCCGPCWSIDRCYGCIHIQSDKFYNGQKVKRIAITTIPYETKDPYFIIIKQKSLTESAYKFWQSVSEQIENAGGIFDKPPVTIKGNIVNINDPTEQVLGFFGASSIVEKSIYIPRNKIDKPPFGAFPNFQTANTCIPCSVGGGFRTDQKPVGW
ncbi:MAG: DUF4249 domain-containing protein [Cyclobacteriaceae bacterium]|nr:DUF4249 domain-containing protein [Cyclobacteriaceae bacterium]